MNLVIQIILAAFGAFLSVVLTKFLIQNGRNIIEEGKRTRNLIESGNKETREILNRQSEVLERIERTFENQTKILENMEARLL